MQINVLDYIDRTVQKYPEKVAISQNNLTLTYNELWERAREIARSLKFREFGRRKPIAVYLPKSIEAVISFVGIMMSENIYCPLDVKSPFLRTQSILENLSPSCIITNREFALNLLDCGWCTSKIIIFEDVGHENQSTQKYDASCAPTHNDTDPVYIIYTSGSTGRPKGVTIAHKGVIDYIDWALGVYRVDSSDIIGSQAPLFFDNSTLDIYLTFARGATLDLMPPEVFGYPLRIIEYIEQRRISFIFWVPSVLTFLANANALKGFLLPRLKSVLFAGEAMPARTLNYWRKNHPNALYSNLYGPTEVTVDCTYYIFNREISDNELVPIGYPCRNTDVFLLDDENKLVTGDDIGELCVRGSSLALGYWNEPQKTQEIFTQNPLRTEYPERIYRTGDLVRRNNHGELVFIGRRDSQIKHHGYRIELGEIEAAASSIAELKMVCVLYNLHKKEIILFYEALVELSPLVLRRKLSQHLPKYMLPNAYHWFEKLPLNENGKIDRLYFKTLAQG